METVVRELIGDRAADVSARQDPAWEITNTATTPVIGTGLAHVQPCQQSIVCLRATDSGNLEKSLILASFFTHQ